MCVMSLWQRIALTEKLEDNRKIYWSQGKKAFFYLGIHKKLSIITIQDKTSSFSFSIFKMIFKT